MSHKMGVMDTGERRILDFETVAQVAGTVGKKAG